MVESLQLVLLFVCCLTFINGVPTSQIRRQTIVDQTQQFRPIDPNFQMKNQIHGNGPEMPQQNIPSDIQSNVPQQPFDQGIPRPVNQPTQIPTVPQQPFKRQFQSRWSPGSQIGRKLQPTNQIQQIPVQVPNSEPIQQFGQPIRDEQRFTPDIQTPSVQLPVSSSDQYQDNQLPVELPRPQIQVAPRQPVREPVVDQYQDNQLPVEQPRPQIQPIPRQPIAQPDIPISSEIEPIDERPEDPCLKLNCIRGDICKRNLDWSSATCVRVTAVLPQTIKSEPRIEDPCLRVKCSAGEMCARKPDGSDASCIKDPFASGKLDFIDPTRPQIQQINPQPIRSSPMMFVNPVLEITRMIENASRRSRVEQSAPFQQMFPSVPQSFRAPMTTSYNRPQPY